jgi:hypothetical protein
MPRHHIQTGSAVPAYNQPRFLVKSMSLASKRIKYFSLAYIPSPRQVIILQVPELALIVHRGEGRMPAVNWPSPDNA